ncbi:MAG: hydrogenase nickel incorporation protein HypA [Desulfurococcaceae archaeon]
MLVHEWALAESIVEYVVKTLGEVRQIKKLLIRIGKLQSIDLEILEFALGELFRERGLSVEQIEFNEIDPRLRCNRCGFEWSVNMDSLEHDVREAIHFLPEAIYVYLKCSRCGSKDFSITSGRGVESIEILW